MLSPTDIDNLIHLRIPETEAREALLQLTPGRVDDDTFRQFLQAMAATGLPVPVESADVMDCCGTGGSGLPHYNTSTTVAFVLAAGGVNVVKFGNRAITSQSGSFDFLEGLGLPIEVSLKDVSHILAQCGVVFLFAPQCYPTLGKFNTLRRSLGVRTIFNFMGPLLNPVAPAYRILGVSEARMQAKMADYLANHTNTKQALVVRGEDGLDELTCHGKSQLYQVTSGQVQQETFEFTFAGPSPDGGISHSTEENLRIFEGLVQGEDTDSIYHAIVCLNAGAGFYVAGKAASIDEGFLFAKDLLAGGKVLETVNRCRRVYAVCVG